MRGLLTSAGFAGVRLRGLSEPLYVGRDVDDACEFISGQFAWMINTLEAGTRARAVDNLRATMADHQTDRGVFYDSATWLIEARRN
ncbi:MAG: hypothetical protein JO281_18710 [Pseudonocardiales bacterium]|nr:hypothetical protein [Pseudonocardiales bacterium]